MMKKDESVLGMNYDDLTKQWHKYLKKEYWPDVKDRDPIEDMSEKLTDHKKANNFYNVSPDFPQMEVWWRSLRIKTGTLIFILQML